MSELTKEEEIERNESSKESPPQLSKKPAIVHPPLKYGKKFYWSEFLAERFIQITAFVSIAVILGIFYYVFQESIYAFKNPPSLTQLSAPASNQSSQSGAAQVTDDNNLKSESYGSDNVKPETYSPSGSDDNIKPESYSPDDNVKPESYSPDDDNSKASSKSDEKQESYGDVKVDHSAEAATDNSEDKSSQSAPDAVSTNKQSQSDMETAGGAGKPVTLKAMFAQNDTGNANTSFVWQPVSAEPKYSLIPLIIGALKVTLIGLFLAAPIAILAAIYTTSFAPRWAREVLKPAIEILAGFPSVVIGFFCLITLASVVQSLFHTTFRLNSFVGGIGMALAVIPIIYTVTEDALAAVPKYLKEASLALGASRWQTAFRVILPAATPGVFAAIILGFGRAFGETMIALMATGNASLSTFNLFDSVRTMSATIGAEMAEVEFHGVHYGVLFFIGAILFVATFSLNALAEFYVRKKLIKKFQGK